MDYVSIRMAAFAWLKGDASFYYGIWKGLEDNERQRLQEFVDDVIMLGQKGLGDQIKWLAEEEERQAEKEEQGA